MLDPKEAIDRLRAAFGGPAGHRTLHAKGGFYEGTFTASPEAGVLCRAEHFSGEPVPVVVRWSNASGHGGSHDAKPDIRGMAVKFRPAAGDTDLLGQTSPRFPTDDPEAFVDLAAPSLRPWKLPAYFVRHPDTFRHLVAGMRAGGVAAPVSYAEVPYYPIHAYGWLDASGARTWVRYTFRPVDMKKDRLEQEFSGEHRLREEIAARLARGPVEFDLVVRTAAEGDDPHSAVSVWKGEREIVAGRISVTGPVDDPEQGDEVVVFDPTRVIDGIELSEDPILLYRPKAYAESVARRQGGARDA